MSKGIQIMLSVYIGENTEERDTRLKQFMDGFIRQHTDMAVDNINIEDASLKSVLDAVGSVPMFTAKKLVIVRYLSTKKDIADKLDLIVANIIDSTELVVVENVLDNRSLYSKNIKKLAENYFEFKNYDGHKLIEWIQETADKHKSSIGEREARHLLDRIGDNPSRLKHEIIKLSLLSDKISLQLITENTEESPKSSIFNMIDAISEGDARRASKIFDEQIKQGNNPIAVLGMIVWQLNILANIVSQPVKDVNAISKNAKINPFVLRKNLKLASKITKPMMVKLLDMAIDTELAIKTGKENPKLAVHALLVQLAVIFK